MSQRTSSDHGPEGFPHQHSEEAQLNFGVSLSWGDYQLETKLEAVGTAVREGAQKVNIMLRRFVHLAIVFCATVVCVVAANVIKPIIRSKYGV